MKVLVTGAAGLIGSTLAHQLLDRGDEVGGSDNLNNYYDVRLKQARLERLLERDGFLFQKLDIVERKPMGELFAAGKFGAVVHLAAQAGVRYSIENPSAYVDANLVGFMHVLEGCRHTQVGHLVFASSSSVYGANTRLPFSEHDNVDHPVSLYAATKKANELMAHSYAHLYRLPCTGLRFFTVYGPWGRPDMALFKFTEGILAGRGSRGVSHDSDDSLDDIVDIGEIAHHFAAVEHRYRPSGEDSLGELEQRHVRATPGTIDGEEPQSGARQPVKVSVAVRHQFVRLLGRRVQRDRVVDIVVLGKRQPGVCAVDGAAGREHEVPDLGGPAAFEHLHESRHMSSSPWTAFQPSDLSANDGSAYDSATSPARRATRSIGMVRPLARSNARTASSTEMPRPVPRFTVIPCRSRCRVSSAAMWPRARSTTWM